MYTVYTYLQIYSLKFLIDLSLYNWVSVYIYTYYGFKFEFIHFEIDVLSFE